MYHPRGRLASRIHLAIDLCSSTTVQSSPASLQPSCKNRDKQDWCRTQLDDWRGHLCLPLDTAFRRLCAGVREGHSRNRIRLALLESGRIYDGRGDVSRCFAKKAMLESRSVTASAKLAPGIERERAEPMDASLLRDKMFLKETVSELIMFTRKVSISTNQI